MREEKRGSPAAFYAATGLLSFNSLYVFAMTDKISFSNWILAFCKCFRYLRF